MSMSYLQETPTPVPLPVMPIPRMTELAQQLTERVTARLLVEGRIFNCAFDI